MVLRNKLWFFVVSVTFVRIFVDLYRPPPPPPWQRMFSFCLIDDWRVIVLRSILSTCRSFKVLFIKSWILRCGYDLQRSYFYFVSIKSFYRDSNSGTFNRNDVVFGGVSKCHIWEYEDSQVTRHLSPRFDWRREGTWTRTLKRPDAYLPGSTENERGQGRQSTVDQSTTHWVLPGERCGRRRTLDLRGQVQVRVPPGPRFRPPLVRGEVAVSVRGVCVDGHRGKVRSRFPTSSSEPSLSYIPVKTSDGVWFSGVRFL